MKHLNRFNESIDNLSFTLEEFADVMQLEWENYKGLEKLYEIVESDITNTDLGKGILTKKVIIKRLADNRFFEFKYSCDDDGQYPITTPGFGNPRIMNGIEVYPHEVTVIQYKYKPQKK